MGKSFDQTDSVKCLGIHLYKYFIWKDQINNIAIKLNKANAILSKIRHYLDIKKSIYHESFESRLYMFYWFECKIHH